MSRIPTDDEIIGGAYSTDELLFTVCEIDRQQQRIEALERVLISIAEQGCESSFDDDQELCSTLPGYDHDQWCNPCLASEVLIQPAEEGRDG